MHDSEAGDPEARLRESWATMGVDVDTLRADEGGSLARDAQSATVEEVAVLLRLTAAQDGYAELVLGDVIGRGGMGVVRSAVQQSLGREVAVKELRAEARAPATIAAMLREARVAGALEHPNIIPVHTIGRDESDLPLIVMKRMEGHSWAELLRETRGTPAHLEVHLPIFLSVCRAAQFAHARGIIHRDIKPDNVMLGELDEVRLVDWGLAVALEACTVSGVPRADATRGVYGTIGYMAPEMATGDGSGLDQRTDVYLLGATLHEVLTGRTRHEGENLMEVLLAAYTSAPARYDASVPAELARIANRATCFDPNLRHADVAELRASIADYLRHRSSMALAERAEARAASADDSGALAAYDPAGDASPGAPQSDDARRRESETALREARFGFTLALAEWPHNEPARRGLARVLERLARRALHRGAFDDATERLAELEALDPTPSAQEAARRDAIAADVAGQRARIHSLEARSRDTDLGAASQTRRVFGVAVGVILGLTNAAFGVLSLLGLVPEGGVPVYLSYLGATGAAALAVVVPALLRRTELYPNAANRRLALALALLVLAEVATFVAAMFLALPLHDALVLSLLQLAGTIAVKTTIMDPRVAWTALVALACGLLAAFIPDTTFFVVGVAYATFFIGGALLSWETGGVAPALVGPGLRAPRRSE